MQKVADAADISVLFFSAGANFLRKQRVEQCRHWCQHHQCYTVVVLSTQVLEAPAQSATVPSAPLHFMPSGLSFTCKRCILKDPTFPPISPHFFPLLFMFDWQFVQVSLMFSDKYDVCRHCLLTQGRFGVFTNKKIDP